jgi:L-fuconolactonase
MRIDAHQHFWRYNAATHGWIDEDMSRIRRDFLPVDLAPTLQANGIEGCVLVQVDQTEEENHFFLQLAAENDFILGTVGWIDLQAEDLSDKLSAYRQHPKLKGFRHILQGESDPDYACRPAFQRGVRTLGKHDYTYDILVFPHQLPAAIDLARNCPDTRLVLDHLAKPYLKKQEREPWATHIRELAALPHVHCKVSGLITEADWHKWRPAHFDFYLQTVLDAFGPARLMFGSDWPVCLVAGEYEQVLGLVEDFFASLSPAEKKGILGQHAIDFYGLNAPGR